MSYKFTNRRMHPTWESRDLPPVPKTKVREQEIEDLIIDAMVFVVQDKLNIAPFLHLFNHVARNDYENDDAVEFVELVAHGLGNGRISKRDVEKVANEVKMLMTGKFSADCPELLDQLGDRDYDQVMEWADQYDEVIDRINNRGRGRDRGSDRGRRRGTGSIRDSDRSSRGSDRVRAVGGDGEGRFSETTGSVRRPGQRRQSVAREPEEVQENVAPIQAANEELTADDVLYTGGNPPLEAYHSGRDQVAYVRNGDEVIQGVTKGFKVDYERHQTPYKGKFRNERSKPTPESDLSITKAARLAAEGMTQEKTERFNIGPIVVSEHDVVAPYLPHAIAQARANRVRDAAADQWPDIYITSWYKNWQGFADISEKEIKTAQYVLDSIHGEAFTIGAMVDKLRQLPEDFKKTTGPRIEALLTEEVNNWLGNMALDISVEHLKAATALDGYLEEKYGTHLAEVWANGVKSKLDLFFNPSIRPLQAIDTAEEGIHDGEVVKPYVELVQLNRLIMTSYTGRELCLEIPETNQNLPVHMSEESHPELTEIFNAVLASVTDEEHTYRAFVVSSDGYVVELMRSWTNVGRTFVVKFMGLVA